MQPSKQAARSRSTWQTIIEILIFSIFATLICIALVGLANLGNPERHYIQWLIAAGDGVVPHIGWALGLYATFLFGLYIVEIGGQLSTNEDGSDKSRRAMGVAAEIVTCIMLPGIFFGTLSLASSPEETGALLVVLPVAILLVSFSIGLGKFVLPTLENDLMLTRRTILKAEATRDRLRPLTRSAWSAPLASLILGNSSSAIILCAYGARDGQIAEAISLIVALIIMSALCTMLAIAGVTVLRIAQNRAESFLAYLILAIPPFVALSTVLSIALVQDGAPTIIQRVVWLATFGPPFLLPVILLIIRHNSRLFAQPTSLRAAAETSLHLWLGRQLRLARQRELELIDHQRSRQELRRRLSLNEFRHSAAIQRKRSL